jgi:hypothetical protein
MRLELVVHDIYVVRLNPYTKSLDMASWIRSCFRL